MQQIQVGKLDVQYRGYRYVDDPGNPEAIVASPHLYRYRVVADGWEDEPDAQTVGYAVSVFDLPGNWRSLYPFEAYLRLAERQGLPFDNDALEKQWNRRFNRVHRRHVPDRVRIDISSRKYYRDLIRWWYRQPMSVPQYPKKLKQYMQVRAPHDIRSMPKDIRRERQKEWDTLVEKCKKYEQKYKQWFAEKPQKIGLPFELSDKALYIVDGHALTKDAIERIERSQPIKSRIEAYPPFRQKLVTLLEIE